MKTAIAIIILIVLITVVLIKLGLMEIGFSVEDFGSVIDGDIAQFGLLFGIGDPGENDDSLLSLSDETFYFAIAIGRWQLMIMITFAGGL